MQIMSFGVAGNRFGIPVQNVKTICNLPEITLIPNAPSYIQGIIMQDDCIIPVYSLADWFRYDTVADTGQGKLIIVNVGEDKAAFTVKELYGIKEIGRDHVRDLPEMLHGENSITQNIADSEESLIVLLNLERLMAVSGYNDVKTMAETA